MNMKLEKKEWNLHRTKERRILAGMTWDTVDMVMSMCQAYGGVTGRNTRWCAYLTFSFTSL